ncbi:MAG TPA: hypothetical protein VF487_15360 [Chitinophagaceae bacterium]
MIKKLFLKSTSLFLLLSLCISANGQTFKTSVSASFNDMPDGNVYKIDNGFIAFKETDQKTQFGYTFKLSKAKFGIKLLQYDASMKLVKENHLLNGEKNFGPLPPLLRKINDKLYLIYFSYGEEESNTLKLLATEIDPVSLQTGAPKELLQADLRNIGIGKLGELLTKAKLIVKSSPDYTKLLTVWSSGLDNIINVSVVSIDLAPVWNRKETISMTDELIVSSAAVDNNGAAYIAYKFKAGRNEYAKHVAIYQSKGRPKDFEVRSNTGSPYQVLLVAARAGNMVYAVGTLTGESGNLTSIFSQTISSSTFKEDKIQTTDFSQDLVTQLDKDGWADTKPKKYGLDGLDMVAYELEDGSIGMVGEFERIAYGEKHSALVSGSILNVRLNSGRAVINWIPKARVSAGRTIGSSYYAFPFKDKLLVFYNDEAANLKIEVGDKYSSSNNYKNVVLVAGWMEADGKIKREKLIDLAAENFLPVGDAITLLSSSSLLVPVRKIKGFGGIDKESKWGTITIE